MPLVEPSDQPAIALHIVESDNLSDWIATRDAAEQAWASAMGFSAALGDTLVLPGDGGAIAAVALGWGNEKSRSRDRFHLARAAGRLPEGRYALQPGPAPLDASVEALGWLLSDYRFTRYAKASPAKASLVRPPEVDGARVSLIAEAATLAQDLINTPANDLGPDALEDAFVTLAAKHGAKTEITRGVDALVAANLPMIAAVGAAATRAPRLLDLAWGPEDAPAVTLVGKGVCFDTGGLNLKPGASMGLMKKDMGGAATALGLAAMIMGLDLPIRLRVLIPAVENSVSGAAMRPGDILPSRKGLSVEVNNTDAEGRLVLADALALAEESAPELIVSLATLTGAARVALGPDVPPFFTDDETIAEALAAAARAEADPLWRLPFWTPYEPLIEPGVADLDNAPGGGLAGAITAALFLRRFVGAERSYLHLDIYGWTPSAKPGRPKGGAFQAARALLRLLETRFCSPG